MATLKNEDVLRAAHKASFQNEQVMNESTMCGCFFCCRVYPVAEVVNWRPDREGLTAICPYCWVDSVIPNASGWPLTDKFLAKMRRRWFGL